VIFYERPVKINLDIKGDEGILKDLERNIQRLVNGIEKSTATFNQTDG